MFSACSSRYDWWKKNDMLLYLIKKTQLPGIPIVSLEFFYNIRQRGKKSQRDSVFRPVAYGNECVLYIETSIRLCAHGNVSERFQLKVSFSSRVHTKTDENDVLWRKTFSMLFINVFSPKYLSKRTPDVYESLQQGSFSAKWLIASTKSTQSDSGFDKLGFITQLKGNLFVQSLTTIVIVTCTVVFLAYFCHYLDFDPGCQISQLLL